MLNSNVPMPLSLLMGHGLFAPRNDNTSDKFSGGVASGTWVSQTRIYRKEAVRQTLVNKVCSANALDQFDFSVLLSLIEVARKAGSSSETVLNKALLKIVFEKGVTLNGKVLATRDSTESCSLTDAISVLSKAVKVQTLADRPITSTQEAVARELDIILHPSVPRAVANIDVDKVARAVFGAKAKLNHRHRTSVMSSLTKLSMTTVKVFGVQDDDLREALADNPKLQTGHILEKYANLEYMHPKDVRTLEWEQTMDTYYNAGLIGNGGRNADGTYRVHFSPVLSLHIAIASADTEAWKDLNDSAKDSVLTSNLWHSVRVSSGDMRSIPIRNQHLRAVYKEVMVLLSMTHINRNYTMHTLLRNIYGEEKFNIILNANADNSDSGALLRRHRKSLKDDLITLYGMSNLTELVKKRKDFEHMLEKLKITIPH